VTRCLWNWAGRPEVKLVAVTACPTGIAHTNTAAEDALGATDIVEADGVIVAAEKKIDRSRYGCGPHA
jgi:fructose-specific phosphotransferase system component IIB